MASKRTENVAIGIVVALGAVVLIGKTLEPRPASAPPPVPSATASQPILAVPQSDPQTSMPKSRQMTEADHAYYEGAFASQSKAFDGTGEMPRPTRRAFEVEGMTQAARDAGYDEATAQRLGAEAAALCNGDPKCLE